MEESTGSTTTEGSGDSSEASSGSEEQTSGIESAEELASSKNPSKVLADPKKAGAKAPKEEDLSPEQLGKMVTLEVDGQKYRMTVKEALKVQQLEKASRQKMNNASNLERKVRELVQRIDDPKEYFKLKGINPEDFAESTLTEKLRLLQESPEQRKAREAQEKLKYYEERERKEAEARELETRTKAEQAAQAGFNKDFVDAWQTTGLPPDRLWGQLMAAEMVSANARKEDLNWKEAAVKVKDKYFSTTRSILSKMDAEAIPEFLGPEVLKKIRAYEVKRVSSGTMPKDQTGQRPANGAASKTPKKLNEQQWDKWWNE